MALGAVFVTAPGGPAAALDGTRIAWAVLRPMVSAGGSPVPENGGFIAHTWAGVRNHYRTGLATPWQPAIQEEIREAMTNPAQSGSGQLR